MKNLIKFYYGLIFSEFRKFGDKYIIKIQNIEYEFTPFYGNVNEIIYIYNILKNYKVLCHEIIINKEKSIITIYENKQYILIKKTVINKDIDLNLINIFNNIPVYNYNKANWKELWKEKLDYYEYQISQIGIKFPLLRDSFSYYEGMSEAAIQLLNFVDIRNIKYSICHKRLDLEDGGDKFLNPINMMIDSRIRDISEYFKHLILLEKKDVNNLISELEQINLNNDEAILLMSRLLYSNQYFDWYDQIVQEKINEEQIEKIIKKNNHYELFLSVIYNHLKNNYRIPEIEWLNN